MPAHLLRHIVVTDLGTWARGCMFLHILKQLIDSKSTLIVVIVVIICVNREQGSPWTRLGVVRFHDGSHKEYSTKKLQSHVKLRKNSLSP
jgi:hypothetical protein